MLAVIPQIARGYPRKLLAKGAKIRWPDLRAKGEAGTTRKGDTASHSTNQEARPEDRG